jgi:hypothetical protein
MKKYTATSATESFPHIASLIRHIFGNQYEYGLDYIQLLITNPTQKLPILYLVSESNGVGKSTFVYLMKLLIGGDMEIVSPAQITQVYNYTWASKFLIACEEPIMQTKKTMEYVKALSTARTITSNVKHSAISQIDCNLHFILTSNNAAEIDPEPRRFWYRNILPLHQRTENFESKLQDETGHFLNFLFTRQLSTECADRMWFRFEDLNRPDFRTRANKLVLEMIQQIETLQADYDAHTKDWKKSPEGLAMLQYIAYMQSTLYETVSIIDYLPANS